jgi:hypothetical protein
MDPDQLPALLDPSLREGRLYQGNRLLSSEFRRGMSKWRTLGNSMLTFLTKIGSDTGTSWTPRTAIPPSLEGLLRG